MKLQTFMKRATLVAFLPGLAMAAKLMTIYNFGSFGQTLDTAKKTEFFAFFHFVETGRELNGSYETIRFQPSGPKFHDLVTLAVETTGGHIKAATLHLSRSFIDGPDEIFARDIAASFLDSTLSDEGILSRAGDLIAQIRNDYRGKRTVIVNGNTDRKVPQPLTPAYLVFLGESVQESVSLKHMDLVLMNTHSGGGQLLIRVELTRPERRASSCGSRRSA
jgi:hypothetical protein